MARRRSSQFTGLEHPRPVPVEGRHQLRNSTALHRPGNEHGRAPRTRVRLPRQPPGGPERSAPWCAGTCRPAVPSRRSRASSSSMRTFSAPGRSALLTTSRSAASITPDLSAWMPSPDSGTKTQDGRVGHVRDVELRLSDPDRFDDDPVEPCAVEDVAHFAGRGGQPAQGAARGHRPDVDARVERHALHPDPVAEERAAAEWRGRDRPRPPPPGVPAARKAVTRRSVSVDLPAPGGPVIPIRRARPSRGMEPGEQRFEPGAAIFDDRDRPRDGGGLSLDQFGEQWRLCHAGNYHQCTT